MKVRFAPLTYRNLEHIRKYIAKESGSREVADRYIDQIVEACMTLAHSARSYPVYRYVTTWRMLPFENYLVLYQIKGDEVRVGRIRHAARRTLRPR